MMNGNANQVQWNLDLTKCQGTREIGSLYRGSVPYILKGQAGKIYRSFYRGLRYIEVRSIEATVDQLYEFVTSIQEPGRRLGGGGRGLQL